MNTKKAYKILVVFVNDKRLHILQEIIRQKKATFTELSIATKLSGTSLQFHLRTLLKMGIITRTTERGPFIMTDNGGRWLYHFEKVIRGWISEEDDS